LAPGESQELLLDFAINDMASYGDMGDIARPCYVLEKGAYTLYVGTSVRKLQALDCKYVLDDHLITEQLQSLGAPEKLKRRMLADGSYLPLECKPVTRTLFPCDYKIAKAPEETYKLIDVVNGVIDLDTFIAQLTDEELCDLVGGQPPTGLSDTCGMENLKRLEVPNVMTIDGPAGVRLRRLSGIKATATLSDIPIKLADIANNTASQIKLKAIVMIRHIRLIKPI
jgi:beta-glucosidase